MLQYHDALKYFWYNAELNLYQGQVPINLMNLFPLLKEGYDAGKTFDNLIYTYNVLNLLFDPTDYRYIIPDDLYNQSFNGNINAFNAESIPQNVFESLRMLDNNFDPIKVNRSYLVQIKGLDSESIEIDPNIKIDLNKELKLSDQIYTIIYKLELDPYIDKLPFETFTFESFMIELYNSDALELLQSLLLDDWIKLLYGIMFNNEVIVAESNIDPRIHNNEAYKLALKYNNPEIIAIIKDKIVRRRLIEQEAISQTMERLIGPSNISKTLFNLRL